MALRRLSIITVCAIAVMSLAACGSGGGKNAAADPRQDIQSKAAGGDAEAQYLVGMEICCGRGDERGRNDLALATQWLCRAAHSGEARAQYRLGLIYGGSLLDDGLGARLWSKIGSGRGPQAKPQLAAMWLDLAMAGGHEDAARKRIVLGKRMSAADHLAVEQLRKKWREAPCELQTVYGASAAH